MDKHVIPCILIQDLSMNIYSGNSSNHNMLVTCPSTLDTELKVPTFCWMLRILVDKIYEMDRQTYSDIDMLSLGGTKKSVPR